MTALAVFAFSASFVACSAASDPRARVTGVEDGSSGSGGHGGAGGGEVGGSGPGDGGPIDPNASCGYAKIPTSREPASLLLVIDRSFSMNEDADGEYPPKFGEKSKWDLTQEALKGALGGLPDDMRMGLLLYPTSSDGCASDAEPQVAIAPLGQTRQVILSYFATPWGDTPTEDALAAAYAHAGALGGVGKKGVVLVTDGAWNCGSDEGAVYTSAKAALNGPKSVLTFAVGVPGSSPEGLSKLAQAGGTERVQNCLVDCGGSAQAENQCCHHACGAATFGEDLATALDDIASTFLKSCVFQVPKGDDPEKFDPDHVNVVLTEEDEAPAFVPRGAFEGWSWVGGDAVEVRGSYCDTILAQKDAKVEIMLGCPSVSE
ncbi:hypothetical protein [Polyangium aurulentum]|uniref:hypothetical protein n=1 Tax=Polyangium aurulentum TaxID=2567896 RepID=UPI0010AE5F27|nr:hypothetical protein [Polyangium aurulentum]UQA57549.1 hypothetical protein E8A73_040755 [Polyangium aurulentum]